MSFGGNIQIFTYLLRHVVSLRPARNASKVKAQERSQTNCNVTFAAQTSMSCRRISVHNKYT